jgi:predicted DNA-binding transcriptional regulator AlpA
MAGQTGHTRPKENEGPARREASFEPLWEANDVAAFLVASRSWVYHRAASGELPCLRVGGLLRFEPAAIRAFAHGELSSPSAQSTPARNVSPKRTR